jgi:hypothetical protein
MITHVIVIVDDTMQSIKHCMLCQQYIEGVTLVAVMTECASESGDTIFGK